MPILWESFLIFMVFIFYKQERYGRRAAAPPLPEPAAPVADPAEERALGRRGAALLELEEDGEGVRHDGLRVGGEALVRRDAHPRGAEQGQEREAPHPTGSPIRRADRVSCTTVVNE